MMRASGRAARMCVMASTPPISGIRKSIRITSGLS